MSTLRNKNIKVNLYALLFFILCVCILRYKTLLLINTHYLGGTTADSGLYVWLFKASKEALNFSNWFTPNAFYPYAYGLAWSDNFILPSVIGTVLITLGLSQAASYNLILLSAITLNGYCTWRLACFINKSAIISITSGVLILFSSFLHEHAGHPQLQFFFWIPLSIEVFYRFVQLPQYNKGLKQTAKYSFIIALTIFGAFFTSVYYAIFIAITLSIFALLLLAQKSLSLSSSLKLASLTAIFLLPIIPFVLPYITVRKAFGPRGLYEPYYFAAKGISYLSTVSRNLLYGWSSKLTHSEAHFFHGIIPLVFILSSTYKSKKALLILVLTFLTLTISSIPFILSYPIQKYVAALLSWVIIIILVLLNYKTKNYKSALYSTGVIFLLLSLGPLGNPEQGHYVFSPAALAYKIFPGFNSIRAVGRIGMVAILVLSIAIPSAILSFKLKNKILLAILITPLIIIENFVTPYPLEKLPEPPKVLIDSKRAIKYQTLIVLPLTSKIDKFGNVERWSDFSKRNVKAMLWANQFNFTTVNGYSGLRSVFMKKLPKLTKDFPSKDAVDNIVRIIGVDYVLFDSNQSKIKIDKKNLDSRLELISSADGYYLFKVGNEIIVNNEVKSLRTPISNTKRFILEANCKGKKDWKLSIEYMGINTTLNSTSGRIGLPIIMPENLVSPGTINFKSVRKCKVTYRLPYIRKPNVAIPPFIY